MRGAALPAGKAVAVTPALLTVAGAALFCGCSASLLNSYRAKDAAAQLAGTAMAGPPWLRLPYGIRYRVSDLQEWIAAAGVPGGVCEGKRRTAAEAAP